MVLSGYLQELGMARRTMTDKCEAQTCLDTPRFLWKLQHRWYDRRQDSPPSLQKEGWVGNRDFKHVCFIGCDDGRRIACMAA